MMKLLICVCLFLFVYNTVSVPWLDIAEEFEKSSFSYFKTFVTEVTQEYVKFKQDYNRVYKNAEEEKQRLLTFIDNFIFVKKTNNLYEQGKFSYKVGINHFSDLSKTELKARKCFNPSKKINRKVSKSNFLKPDKLPNNVDWRDHNYVTPVKDQGKCGSCYAFSTTGSLEGQYFRKTGLLISLSEQQIVDCSLSFGDDGCHGGEMSDGFEYILSSDGIDTEESYPYVSGITEKKEKTCNYNSTTIGARIVGYANITPSGHEGYLEQAVATIGPISVAIDVNDEGFMHYTEGIYYNPMCRNDMDGLNHAVLVVGYGVQSGIPYWLVKNSWSTKWGMDGYVKMRRNAFNMCGIATAAVYPIV